jgi:hypothetical protein
MSKSRDTDYPIRFHKALMLTVHEWYAVFGSFDKMPVHIETIVKFLKNIYDVDYDAATDTFKLNRELPE